MSDISISIITYVITIVISFFVAGIIQLMVNILGHFIKNEPVDTNFNIPVEIQNSSPDQAAVAAVIAIAKNQ